MRTLTLITALTGTAILAGCTIDPQDHATTPVQVQTAQGIVTCQLYTKENVIWDEAISAPAGMSIQQADRICKAEGQRRKDM
jgi:ABC-type uncharacterized transport system auxiliary subunit